MREALQDNYFLFRKNLNNMHIIHISIDSKDKKFYWFFVGLLSQYEKVSKIIVLHLFYKCIDIIISTKYSRS